MDAASEHRLLERCREGDEQAFRELVERYKRLVFALVARSITDRGRAEEVAQEVMLELWRRRETLAVEQSFRAYLDNVRER